MIASSVATAGSFLFLILPNLSNIALFIFKLLLGIVVCAIACARLKVKQMLFIFLLFILFTFILGGIIIGILSMLNESPTSIVSPEIQQNVPIGLIGIASLIFCKLVFYLTYYLEEKKQIGSFLKTGKIKINGIENSFIGLLDSGNLLDFGGVPVAVISQSFACKFMTKKDELYFRKENYDSVKLKVVGILSFSSACKTNNRMLLVKPEDFEIEGVKSDVYVGLSNEKLGNTIKFDVLLSPKMI